MATRKSKSGSGKRLTLKKTTVRDLSARRQARGGVGNKVKGEGSLSCVRCNG